MHISLKSFLFCLLFLLNLFSFQKLYADRIIQSEKLVENLYNDLVATSIKELSIDKQKIELKNLFQKYVDINIIARAVLGKSWRQANSDQRKRFISVFKTYVSNLNPNALSAGCERTVPLIGLPKLNNVPSDTLSKNLTHIVMVKPSSK